jgi:hypothetical protein
MLKGAQANTMNLNDLMAQSERAIKDAGPRFTPGLDAGAPNIRIEHLVDALDSLSIRDGFRARIQEYEEELRKALKYTRRTIDDVFKGRVVTPVVVADDLLSLCML